jgi:hypothetical protein
MNLDEALQAMRQPKLYERTIRGQLQHTLCFGIEDTFYPVLDMLQGFAHYPEVRSPGQRKLDRATSAREQLAAQLVLEQHYLLTDGRLAHVQLRGCV